MASPLSASSLPALIAHRGASWRAPENTLAAVRLAWDEGADAVEVDVHRTRDDQVVVIHDPTLNRTTSGRGRVAGKTLAEIRPHDAGSWKSAEFRAERVPTIAEVLALVPAEKAIFIEVKSGPETAPALARELAGRDPAGVTLISFHADVLAALRPLLPRHELLFLVDYRRGQKAAELLAAAEVSRAAGFQGLDISARWPVDRETIAAIQALGQKVVVWTVDDPSLAQQWIARGVTGITTNRPEALRRALSD